MPRHIRIAAALASVSAISLGVGAIPACAQAAEEKRSYNIEAQALGDALSNYAEQSGIEIIFTPDAVRGKRSNALRGSYTPTEALVHLLRGTGLMSRHGSGTTIIVDEPLGKSGRGSVVADNASAVAVTPADRIAAATSDGAIAEILVTGRKSQNVDIRRTENDPQPYVIFQPEEIERSQAESVGDFLRSRLPMNARNFSTAQAGEAASNTGNVDLRGLGVNQTLILVDGRRQPKLLESGRFFTQADINGIPLSAIERIEILPSTAGGIYGGGAVGGVINIIRKRNYSGLELFSSYAGAMQGGGESLRVDGAGGFNLEGGNTQVSFSASYSESQPFRAYRNNLLERARALLAENDPGFFNTAPLGYTPNIRSVTGENLVLDDGRSLGSPFTYVPRLYRGAAATDGGDVLLKNAGQYNLDLGNTAASPGLRQVLVAGTRVQSGNVNLRRQFGARFDAFADFTISDNFTRTFQGASLNVAVPASASSNPFQQDVDVVVPVPLLEREIRNRSQVLHGTAGLIARLGAGWTATAEYSLSRSRNKRSSTSPIIDRSAIATAIENGTLDLFQDLNTGFDVSPFTREYPNQIQGPYDSVQQTVAARTSGNIFKVPAGSVGLTALLEHRHESAKLGYLRTADFIDVQAPRAQSAWSGYVELRAPVVSHLNAFRGLYEFELQASIRHDRYETQVSSPTSAFFITGETINLPEWGFGEHNLASTDFTLGFRMVPIKGLTVRGSYGTGFLPPGIDQLVSEAFTIDGPIGLGDPYRGNRDLGGEVPIEIVSGGNRDLRPERSESFSAGIIIEPIALPGFRVSLDYLDIRKTDEIGYIDLPLLIANYDKFADLVDRGTNRVGDLPGWPGPVTRIVGTAQNIARSRIKAFDLQADYTVDTQHLGQLRFYSVATLTTGRWTEIPPLSGYDVVNSANGPLRWRGNLGADWTYGPLEMMWNMQYYGSYRVTDPAYPDSYNQFLALQQGGERIGSQAYHDVGLRYRVPGGRGALSNIIVQVGVQNVFNTKPPVDTTLIGRGGFSSFGDAKLRRFSLSIKKLIGVGK